MRARAYRDRARHVGGADARGGGTTKRDAARRASGKKKFHRSARSDDARAKNRVEASESVRSDSRRATVLWRHKRVGNVATPTLHAMLTRRVCA
jgi:hypothetical protein